MFFRKPGAAQTGANISRVQTPIKIQENLIMAVRGAKPKATILKLVTNKPGHKPLPKDEPRPTCPLGKRPTYLTGLFKGRATVLWNQKAADAWWLSKVDGDKLGIWCCLQAEFERAPESMNSARIGQLRALGSELGLDPASRTRMEGYGNSAPTGKKDPYFD